MNRRPKLIALLMILAASSVDAQWVARDHRWPPRGPWTRALPRELPRLYREFNGIDFGHAHLGETLLRTQDPAAVERARLEVLDFIFTAPSVPPDEEQVAPNLTRLLWEVQKSFDWAHAFHRSLYDLFASRVEDKERAYRALLADYLRKPEAITDHPLDHHGKLWSFPESRSFKEKFPRFNSQIWAYHWLQAAAYDVQLDAGPARQRELFPLVIERYHGYLAHPPLEWTMMPMVHEAAPGFAKRFPEAASIFDNLHMLHDNLDDVLSRPDLYPTSRARRQALLLILEGYLHRNHAPRERFESLHGAPSAMSGMGPRPPSAREVLDRRQTKEPDPSGTHEEHGHE